MLTGSKPTNNTHRKQQSLSAGTASARLLFFLLKLSVSLCLFLSLSLAPSVSLPLSSRRLLHLYHFFFAPELSFSPLLLLSPLLLSVLSLLSAPAAMWSRRGSRVTEAGPFGVASSLSRLRGAAVHVHSVFVCVRAGRCSRGQSEV